jgi:hypothetical protein
MRPLANIPQRDAVLRPGHEVSQRFHREREADKVWEHS